jgi:hypothetical protein
MVLRRKDHFGPEEQPRSWVQVVVALVAVVVAVVGVSGRSGARIGGVRRTESRKRSGANLHEPSLKAGVRKDRGFESPRFRHRSDP